MVYILSNRAAGGLGDLNEKKVGELLKGATVEFSMSKDVDDKRAYLSKITANDILILIGGDGTLNRFVNSIDDIDYPFPIYCYAGGTGNDFLKDVAGDSDGFVKINDYIKRLPILRCNGESYRFINGVGLGFDGYCCAKVNEHKDKTGKSGSYKLIAIKGLFGAYKKTRAKVTVDGVTEEFSDVWLASTMHGRFYGGGMMITPEQKRNNPEGSVSFAIAHSKSPISILLAFSSVYKGTHVKKKKIFKITSGSTVKVEFDRPCTLQMDGETIDNVSSYEVFYPEI